jgi:hypothetical protein
MIRREREKVLQKELSVLATIDMDFHFREFVFIDFLFDFQGQRGGQLLASSVGITSTIVIRAGKGFMDLHGGTELQATLGQRRDLIDQRAC